MSFFYYALVQLSASHITTVNHLEEVYGKSEIPNFSHVTNFVVRFKLKVCHFSPFPYVQANPNLRKTIILLSVAYTENCIN